jgi:hypothetical protein
VNQWFVPLVAYRTTTQSVTSSTTLVNDNTLFVSVVASSAYLVELVLNYDADTAGDLKIGWTAPAGAVMTNVTQSSLTGTAATFTDDQMIAAVSVPVSGGLGAGNNAGFLYKGFLNVSSTAGTLQLQFAQGTSSAVATRLFAGSYLLAQRVG